MQLAEKDIQLLQNFFRDKPVLKAFIFGSYARNEADEKSDLDILVELDYSRHVGLEFAGMQLDLETMLKKKVDLVSQNGLSKFIAPLIATEKKLIYEKAAGR